MAASGTSQLYLWLPAVLFAHLFAGAWLLRTYILCHPGVVQRLLLRLRRGRHRTHQAGAGSADAHHGVVVAVPARVWANRDNSSHLYGAHWPSDAAGSTLSSSSGGTASNTLLGPNARRNAPQLEWRGIGCSYETDAGVKTVLQDVWGTAQPGEMQAILGPSGSGKTSLLDILAQRKSTGTLTGELLLDGLPLKSWRKSKSRAAYVPQDDNFVPTMTAEETMHFAAAMTLPDSWSASRRRQRVNEALAMVGLAGQHAVMVGGLLPGGLQLRGLSGGERKRLGVAAGILATPSMLFLDEPTSGLDSFAALSVVGSVRRMAAQAGLVVLASIHQPSARIWALFDRITLLASGCLLYHGTRDGMLAWLGPDGLGFSYDARLHGAPSDWALDIVAIGFPKPQRDFGRTLTSLQELQAAAQRFKKHCTATQATQAPQQQALALADADSASSSDRASSSQLGTIMEVEASSGADASSSGQLSDADADADADGDGDADGRCKAQAGSHTQVCVHAFSTSKGSADTSVQLVLAGNNNRQLQKAQGQQLTHQLAAQPSASGACQQGQQQQQQQQGRQGKARPPLRHLRRQYTTLVWREFLSVTRNPADAAGRMLTFAWVAILQGIIFWGLPDDASSLRGRLNLLFAILCFFMLMPFISMGLYSADKRFYITDVASRLYHPAIYYAAKVTATLPFSVLAAHIYDATIYGMAGLRHGITYEVQHGSIAIMVSLVSVQVLHLSAMVAPNQDLAFMMAVTWSAVNLLMSGFLVEFGSMAYAWLGELRYISAMYYAFEGFARAEFQDRELTCAVGVAPDNLDAMLRSALPNTPSVQSGMAGAALQSLGEDCVVATSAVLDFFQLRLGFWGVLGSLVLYWWLLHVLTFCAMLWLARRERR